MEKREKQEEALWCNEGNVQRDNFLDGICLGTVCSYIAWIEGCELNERTFFLACGDRGDSRVIPLFIVCLWFIVFRQLYND